MTNSVYATVFSKSNRLMHDFGKSGVLFCPSIAYETHEKLIILYNIKNWHYNANNTYICKDVYICHVHGGGGYIWGNVDEHGKLDEYPEYRTKDWPTMYNYIVTRIKVIIAGFTWSTYYQRLTTNIPILTPYILQHPLTFVQTHTILNN